MDPRAQGPTAADRPAKRPDAGLELISDVCAKVTSGIPGNVAVKALVDAAWSSRLDQRQQIMVMRIRQAIQRKLPQTLTEAQAVSFTDDEKLDLRRNFSKKTRCWQRLFKIPDEKVIIHDETSVRLRPLRRFHSRPPPTGNSCTSGGVHRKMVLPLSLLRNQRPATTESDTTTQRPLATARRAAKAADILLFWPFLNDMGTQQVRTSGKMFSAQCKRTAVSPSLPR